MGSLCQGILAQKTSKATELSKKITEFKIKPSSTDSTITNTDVPHLVWYDAIAPQGKLFLFLPGTNGIPERGPKKLFETAIQQGYRVVNLSYINKQAVARICKGENLVNDIDCTEKFRTQRIFGTKLMSLIPDEPQDAIINRLVKLLTHLNEIDKAGNWSLYLKDNKINWNIITVAGQSQGGGMAAFIAKKKIVNKIITFSGGWDFSERNSSGLQKIAKWYSNKSETPANRWFGIYHLKEPLAAIIDQTYKAMAIPENHIYSLDLPIREGKKAHGEGVRNVVYIDMWEKLLGDGRIKSN